MPTIFFYGPKLDKEKRKEMIKSFTDTTSRLTGVDKSALVVYLRESTPEDVGVGGGLLEDMLKERESRQYLNVDFILLKERTTGMIQKKVGTVKIASGMAPAPRQTG